MKTLEEVKRYLNSQNINNMKLNNPNKIVLNMINILILAICDIAYAPRALLNSVSKTNLLTALIGIIMTATVYLGIKNKHKRTFLGLGWDSYMLSIMFLLAMSLAYHFR